MLKIRVLSDLHFELLSHDGSDDIPKMDVNLTIIAGDYHKIAKAIGHARSMFPNGPLLMVCGNHEHYKSGMSVAIGVETIQADALLDSQLNHRVTRVLENDTVVLDIRGQKVRIIGATLWTDFELFQNYAGHSSFAHASMNDYVCIKGPDDAGRLRPQDTRDWHLMTRAYIERELRMPFDGRTIVVTHHLPSLLSVAPHFKTDSLTPAFASNCDDLIRLQPDLWIHGHTHDSCDYRVGHTRIVCNPRGYGGHYGRGYRYENKNFDPRMVVEL